MRRTRSFLSATTTYSTTAAAAITTPGTGRESAVGGAPQAARHDAAALLQPRVHQHARAEGQVLLAVPTERCGAAAEGQKGQVTQYAAGRKLLVNAGRERRSDGYDKHLGYSEVGTLRVVDNQSANAKTGAGLELVYAKPDTAYLLSYSRDASDYRD